MVSTGTEVELTFTRGNWEQYWIDESGRPRPNLRIVVNEDVFYLVSGLNFKPSSKDILSKSPDSTILGDLCHLFDLRSKHLALPRNVSIWVPPGYGSDTQKRYPVLYMQDGQNLFDSRLCRAGTDWGVDETVVSSINRARIREIIVVGVWSTERRILEYSPWHEGGDYAKFLQEELVPLVNSNWRTMSGPANTFAAGSSMGALISFYLAWRSPQYFGGAACLSTHFPFPANADDANVASSFIDAEIKGGAVFAPRSRIYIDRGTEGADSGYAQTTERVLSWLRGQGYKDGENLLANVFEGAGHSERYWRSRLQVPLEYLFGI